MSSAGVEVLTTNDVLNLAYTTASRANDLAGGNWDEHYPDYGKVRRELENLLFEFTHPDKLYSYLVSLGVKPKAHTIFPPRTITRICNALAEIIEKQATGDWRKKDTNAVKQALKELLEQLNEPSGFQATMWSMGFEEIGSKA